jgi:hypothetical protein
MTRLCADLLFGVDGLVVAGEMRGRSYEFRLPQFDGTLTFPERDDQYKERLGRDWGLAISGSSGTRENPEQWVAVHYLNLKICGEGPVSFADFEQDRADAAKKAIAFFDNAVDVATTFLAQCIEWLRADGQAQLGLQGQIPELAGLQSLFDAEVERRLPVGHTWKTVVSVLNDRGALTERSVNEVIERAATGAEVPTAAALIADAMHMLRGTEPDLKRAVLSAAIAAELLIKEALRVRAKPDAALMVDVLLDNPRDFSVAAAALFDKPLAAVCGHSLKDEDRDLYVRIQRLFERRNSIAHRGADIPRPEAADSVRAARDVADWLSELPS